MPDVLRYTVDAYFKNIKMVSFFSLLFLLAFLIPLLSPTPTYLAMGATYLRTGSMYIDLTMFDVGVIVFSFILSLFLISFTIVAINLLIKSQRTLTSIRKEVLEGVEKYTVNVFWLYLTAWILCFIVNLVAYDYGVNEFVTPLFALIISLPLFYAPTAMVIDEQRPITAMKTSLFMIRRRFKYFIMWLIFGIALLSLTDAIFILLEDVIPFSQFLVLVINSMIVLPFLIMLQVQIYLTKYTILR